MGDTISILLLSEDSTLGKTMGTILPSAFTLQWRGNLRRQPTSAELDSWKAPIIVADMRELSETPLWFSKLRDRNSRLIAIISDLSQRKVVFQAGCDDYLLVPLVPDEVKARLMPWLRQPDEASYSQARLETDLDPNHDALAQQALQNQRLLIIGRLISRIYHEVTNRMQAVDGSLSLALEEPGLSQDLQKFLEISKHETRRANKIIDRLRRLYRPELDTTSIVDPTELLREVVALASDEMINRGVKIEARVPADLPAIDGKYDQLQFALLGVMLNLINLSKGKGEDTIYVQARTVGPTLQIELITDMPISGWVGPDTERDPERKSAAIESLLAFSMIKETSLSHHGEAGILIDEPGLSIWMSLPLS